MGAESRHWKCDVCGEPCHSIDWPKEKICDSCAASRTLNPTGEQTSGEIGRDFIGNVVPLWTCPACAFTFDARHTDMAADGMTHTDAHSCPQCAEARLRAALEKIAAEGCSRMYDTEVPCGCPAHVAREALDG